MKPEKRLGLFEAAVFLLLAGTGSHALGQAREPVLSLAKKEKPALLETLKTLVAIETGSRDDEGLAKLAGVIAGRLKELGGRVELVEPSDVYKMEDTPEKIGKMVRQASWERARRRSCSSPTWIPCTRAVCLRSSLSA
jgi:glutamate carboxypeptidase